MERAQSILDKAELNITVNKITIELSILSTYGEDRRAASTKHAILALFYALI
jgi:hypothetical protein